MSLSQSLNNLNEDIREKIHDDLEIIIKPKFNFSRVKYMYPYHIDHNDQIFIPFNYAVTNMKIKRNKTDVFSKREIVFNTSLRDEQKVVRKEALNILSKNGGSVILSMYCGFGKSATSMNLACKIGFKTLIIVNKIVLIKQWEEGINKFIDNAKIQKLTPKSKLQQDTDFYIMNAQNIEKLGHEFFSDIGTVIVDECHLIMAETLSRCLQYLCPRYLIGLSATPYRPDGFDKLLDLYFGKENKIVRKLHRNHTVYKLETGFIPTIEYSMNGKINWGKVLDSQANNSERNELIVSLVKKHSDRNFLILVKRIAQGNHLYKRLLEEQENVTTLLGKKQDFDRESRILIGTSSKVGVGFDHSKLDALLLATDLEEYFIQYLGRVFRRKDVEPIIFDLVDDYTILKKHFNTRKKIYKQHGGEITTIKLNTE